MTRDNVTPFRRRPPPPKPQKGNPLKSHRGKVILVHALTLIAFGIYVAARFMDPRSFVGFIGLAFGIAAVAIAASNRMEGMPWAMTHHEQALRTIVIGAAVWTIASLLLFLPMLGVATLWIQALVALWVLIRACAGLVLAALRRPVFNAKGLLL
ncbi:MAG: hypothetical protein AB7O04_02475 [Hyphomonadaceae bacterium]